jgi:hypothetical protein
MLDGPATFAAGASPARSADCSRAPRSGEPSGSAYGGHRVMTSTSVGRVPGHAASILAAAARSSATAAGSSSAGVSRISTLTLHKSGAVE